MPTEKRLIDAYDVKELINGLSELPWEEKVDYLVDSLPTVDAVEVVRCKDCKHWYEPEGVCLKIYSDGDVSPYAWQYRNADDFCSYGERKYNEVQG